MRKISRGSPFITQFSEVLLGAQGTVLCLVMEFCSGGDLRTTLRNRKDEGEVKFPEEQVPDVGLQARTWTLAHAHSRTCPHPRTQIRESADTAPAAGGHLLSELLLGHPRRPPPLHPLRGGGRHPSLRCARPPQGRGRGRHRRRHRRSHPASRDPSPAAHHDGGWPVQNPCRNVDIGRGTASGRLVWQEGLTSPTLVRTWRPTPALQTCCETQIVPWCGLPDTCS